jgi:hypothetical protein
MENFLFASDYYLARLLFERSLAALYFIGFLVGFLQCLALMGETGLLPVKLLLQNSTFKETPSLFHLGYSDRWLKGLCLIGMLISLAIVAGMFSQVPHLIYLLTWVLLYFFYLSIVNVGQIFYGFGWESMLLEAGFFAGFMGPLWSTPSWIPIIILRWMLFRTEFGAGLIKLRGDQCWRDLTCLYYHYETQPLPNPLSRRFHLGPKLIHRIGVLFSHLIQLIVPFGLFFPQPVATVAGILIILHQLILIISGNYSWLNWITISLAFTAFSDPYVFQVQEKSESWYTFLLLALAIFTLVLSYQPFLNLFAKKQKMNYCWNRYHLIGAYGAFGSVTKKRYEIVILARISF